MLLIGQYNKLKERYIPQRIIAQELGIPVQILGRITSSFKCERGGHDKYVRRCGTEPMSYGVVCILARKRERDLNWDLI